MNLLMIGSHKVPNTSNTTHFISVAFRFSCEFCLDGMGADLYNFFRRAVFKDFYDLRQHLTKQKKSDWLTSSTLLLFLARLLGRCLLRSFRAAVPKWNCPMETLR